MGKVSATTMNFLAHILLAGPAPADRLGAILGDFVKGPLPCGLPADVAEGVRLHRAIDSYADTHPAFRRSRGRMSPERRRYSGIMVDLFYDHFLAVHWGRYHPQPLEEFTADFYALLAAQPELLPPRLADILPSMRANDWLSSYREIESVGVALDRMAERRLRQPNRLGGAVEELERHYTVLEEDFLAFFTDARLFARR